MAKEGKKNKSAEDKKPKDTETPAASSSNYDDLGGPGSGGNFVPKDHQDDLLLISPLSLEEGIVTSNGTKDAIKADIVILDKGNPGRSEEIRGGLVFPNVLQSQLQDALRKRSRVVGTLILDEASKKPGQNAPWRLTAPSEDDIQVARKYLDSLNPLR